MYPNQTTTFKNTISIMKIVLFFVQVTLGLNAFNNLGFMQSVSNRKLQNFQSKGSNVKLSAIIDHQKGPLNIMGSHDCSLIQTGVGRKRLICGDQLANIIRKNKVKRSINFQRIFQ